MKHFAGILIAVIIFASVSCSSHNTTAGGGSKASADNRDQVGQGTSGGGQIINGSTAPPTNQNETSTGTPQQGGGTGTTGTQPVPSTINSPRNTGGINVTPGSPHYGQPMNAQAAVPPAGQRGRTTSGNASGQQQNASSGRGSSTGQGSAQESGSAASGH